MTIETPGMTAPWVSATVPWSVPVDCARAGAAAVSSATTRGTSAIRLILNVRLITHLSLPNKVCPFRGQIVATTARGAEADYRHDFGAGAHPIAEKDLNLMGRTKNPYGRRRDRNGRVVIEAVELAARSLHICSDKKSRLRRRNNTGKGR